MKTTQEISRQDLANLYKDNTICDNWKKKIANLLVEQINNSSITVPNSLIVEANNSANEEQKKLIKKYFDIIVPKSIKDIIKTEEDIWKYHNINPFDVLPYRNPKTKIERHLNAIVKINYLSKALNEGWTEKFGVGQYNYYPYFYKEASGWVVASCDCSVGAAVGSGFYYKNSDLALYAGKQFLEIYKDYLPE